jgi:hypothetical protein
MLKIIVLLLIITLCIYFLLREPFQNKLDSYSKDSYSKDSDNKDSYSKDSDNSSDNDNSSDSDDNDSDKNTEGYRESFLLEENKNRKEFIKKALVNYTDTDRIATGGPSARIQSIRADGNN